MSAKPNQAVPSRRQLANAIRALSMDAVQKGQLRPSRRPDGHGRYREVLWNDFMVHNPATPKWRTATLLRRTPRLDADLFAAASHWLCIADGELKNFRQPAFQTSGSPGVRYAPGVETTTGPLGQGITMPVGLAIAEKALAGRFKKNQKGHDIVDHHTMCSLGDGCLMEGISHEAARWPAPSASATDCLLGRQRHSIDGHVEGWFTDNTADAFRGVRRMSSPMSTATIRKR